MGERRVAVVDRFVLADEAAQLLRYGAGARLERGIGEALARLDSKRHAGKGGSERKAEQ